MNQWATRKAAPTEIFTMAKYRRQEGIDTLEKEIESEMAQEQPAPLFNGSQLKQRTGLSKNDMETFAGIRSN